MNDSKTENDAGRRALANVLYVLSLLIMLAVAGITIWPEIELQLFDRPLIVEERLQTLHCPPAMTPDEEAAVSATFVNERDQNQRFRAQARFSYLSASLMDEFEQWVELAPGEREVVRWSLDPQSAAFGRMILVRVHVSRRGNIPPQQGGCGVMVLDLPAFTGTQYVLGMVLGALLILAASGLLWWAGRNPARVWQEEATRHRALLTAAVAGAMFAGLLNLWVVGCLLLLVGGLLLVSFTQHWGAS